MRPFSTAVLPSLILVSHLQGATLASSASGESVVYVVDSSDLIGPAASGISPYAQSGIVCVNNFRVVGGYSTIVDVTVHWGLILGTTAVTAGIWSDPDQDGVPDDAVLLAFSAPTQVTAGQYLQQVAFSSPQYVGPEGTSFFVGFYWQDVSPDADLFMGKDRPLQPQWPSWHKTWTDAPPDPTDLGAAYNYQGTHRAFVIRPTGVVPEPSVLSLLVILGGSLARRTRPSNEGCSGG